MENRYTCRQFTLILFIGLLFPQFALTGTGPDEVSLSIEKIYPVRSDQLLRIFNMSGEVAINTWENDSLLVIITLIARGHDRYKAEERLDRLDIRERITDAVISLQTRYSSDFPSWSGFSGNLIANYEVWLPAAYPLEITHRNGNIYLEDREGDTDIVLKYGDLSAGRLDGKTNRLYVRFGKTDIGHIGNGHVDVGFGELFIESAGSLRLDSRAASVVIDQVDSLHLNVSMGGLRVVEANLVEGTYSAAGFRLGKLNHKMDMEGKLAGKLFVDELADDFVSIDLSGSFASFELTLPVDIPIELDARMAHGRLKANRWLEKQIDYDERAGSRSYQLLPDSTARASGKVGKITVDSRHGNLYLN